MIGRVRNVRLLRGFRGTVPLDEEEAARVLVALGDLGTLFPEIEQIDINPLVVKDGSPVAVDASVILGS
jgi:acetate---CoA ligase (ADP-forming)